MPKMTKIAISLPEDLLEGIERKRLVSGESRSQFFRRAVGAFLRSEREREAIEQYVQGYRQYPEGEEEIALAETTTHLAIYNSKR